MSNPWGGIGAWAADVEREEREEAAAAASGPVSAGGLQNFPSLKEAVTTKPKKKKMSLNKFHTETPAAGSRFSESKGLTPDEIRSLPTGPRQRSSEEMQNGSLGGGFSTYGRTGYRSGDRTRDREDAGQGGWGGGRGRQFGGFDEDRRASSHRSSANDLPSRADEVDNWATTKKPLPVLDSNRPSRADEVDNWAVGKKQIAPSRSSTFDSSFRRSSGLEADRWSRGSGEPVRERPRLVSHSPNSTTMVDEQPSKTSKPNPFGGARPREEVLAEKGMDWKKMDQSSRPSSSHSSGSIENAAIIPRPKVNPFGEAKQREILMEKRGQDWKKIDLELEHRTVERPDTEEERLKETLENLQNLDDKIRFGQKTVDRPGSGGGRIPDLPERPPSQSGSVDESRNVESLRATSRGQSDSWTGSNEKRRGYAGSRDFDRPRLQGRW